MPKAKARIKAPTRITKAREFINTLAPTHEKISCSDAAKVQGGQRVETIELNSRFASDDFGGCYRCTLMAVHNFAVAGELAEEKDEDD